MKFAFKTIIRFSSFLIGAYALILFFLNPTILKLTLPLILIAGLAIFLIYRFARPRFDKGVKEASPYVRKAAKNLAGSSSTVARFVNTKLTDQAVSNKNKHLDLDRLKKLHDLVEEGVLTQEEFEAKKKEML